MSIARFSIKNAALVNVITIVVFILGLYFSTRLSREVFPSFDFGYITISTSYSGASPEEMENLVTIPIEDEISDVDGIDEITSTSSEGMSVIRVQADADIEGAELDQLLNDLKNEVDKVSDLPDDADDPNCVKFDPEFSVISVGLWGDIPESELRELADWMQDELELVDGVSSVDIGGYRDREFWVEVDPLKLEATNLSMTEIVSAIKRRNLNTPSGTIESGTKEILIRAIGEVETMEDIEDIVVASRNGVNITVGDLARVTETFEEEESISRLNGHRAVMLLVKKKTLGDVIDIVDDIRVLVSEVDEYLPEGAHITLLMDDSKYVRARLKTLLLNGLFGIILVVGVLYVFLDSRVAFWASIGIPFSFLATIIVMYGMGITFNLLSMFALILVLGIVVDDAIVVAENTFRHLEEGRTLSEATIIGTNEVAVPVTAAIATNIVVFIPLTIMVGILGKIMNTIAVVVITVLLASLLEAFLVLPSHLVEFGKKKENTNGGDTKAWFESIREYYGNAITTLIGKRYMVIFGALALAVITVIFGALTLKVTFMGKRISEKFNINITMPVDTNLEETDRIVKEVETYALELPERDVAGVITSVSDNSGRVQVELTEHGYKKVGSSVFIAELREKTDLISGALSITYQERGSGPRGGSAVEAHIHGDDYDTLLLLADEFKEELSTIPGVTDIDDDFEKGKEEVKFYFDEYIMGTLGLSITSVSSELRSAFSGSDAGDIREGGDKIEILVKYDEDMQNIDNLLNFSVTNDAGERIPIKVFADIEFGRGLLKISRTDRMRDISVSAEVIEGVTTSTDVNKYLIDTFGYRSETYPGYTFDYGGEFRRIGESLESLYQAFIVAVLLIYVILVALFRSYIQPLIIMATVPLSFIGVVYGLFISNVDLSMMAMVGIIALVGIVINDSLVLIDFINRSREKGMSAEQAVIESGKVRLRPIILTTLTTIGGLLPMAIGIGGKEPMLTPMAVSIVWGLLFAMVLTLVVIPCLYMVVEDIKMKLTGNR